MEQYDILITNASVVDGTGAARFRGRVGIRGDRIVAVGEAPGTAGQVIDGSGLVVCPGFVDAHSHADLSILQYPLAENLIAQGITTFVGGNCGLGLSPLRDAASGREMMRAQGTDMEPDWMTFGQWLGRVEESGTSLNYVPLVGHNAIRTAVLGDDFQREAAPGEIAHMQAHVEEAMASGAFGLSCSFDPSPGAYASTTEMLGLLEVARSYGGLFAPHTRHHQNQWPAEHPTEYAYGLYQGPRGEIIAGRYHGLLEAVELAEAAQISLLIAHLTPAYLLPQPAPDALVRAAADATLALIVDAPREQGLSVHFTVLGWSQSISSQAPIMDSLFNPRLSLPAWLKGMRRDEFAAGLADGAFRDRVRAAIESGHIKFGMAHPLTDPYWMDTFRILRCRSSAYEGKSIGELARKRSRFTSDVVYRKAYDVLFDILAEDPAAVWAMTLDKREHPAALPVFLRHPAAMPCTDVGALSMAPDPSLETLEGKTDLGPNAFAYGIAPLTYALFPHYLRQYVREDAVLSLEEAIYKTTALPACEVLGLPDRGILSPGAYADIVLFDPDTIGEKGDFLRPAQAPIGINTVIVNGAIVWAKGRHTGAKPGRVLRRQQDQAKSGESRDALSERWSIA